MLALGESTVACAMVDQSFLLTRLAAIATLILGDRWY